MKKTVGAAIALPTLLTTLVATLVAAPAQARADELNGA